MTEPPEPTGHTIDGTPWEEPRPPHVPDPMVAVSRRVPLASWVFLAIAAVLGAGELRGFAGSGASLGSVATLAVNVIYVVAPALLGAAFLIRHPHGWRTHPRILFGIVLLTLAEVWSVAHVWVGAGPLADVLGTLDAPGPVAVGLSLVSGLLRIFGIAYVARGLSNARSTEHDLNAGRRTTALALVAFGAVVLEVVAVGSAIARSATALDSGLFASSVVSVFVRSALFVVWAYLLSAAWDGAASRDRPTIAWRAAAIGAGSVFLAGLIVLAVSVYEWLFLLSIEAFDWINATYWTSSIVSVLGFLTLIAAFALGLPELDESAHDVARTTASVDGPADVGTAG